MGGYLHLTQFHVPEGLRASAMSAWMDGGTTAASGLVGESDSGEPVVIVGHERPAEFSLPIGKKAAEAVHVQKFRVDCRARGAGDPFGSVRPSKADPPDFVVLDQDGDALGLECAAFADESRRSALGHLFALESRLERLGSREFRQLRDTAVYVYFEDAGGLGMPRRGTDHAGYEALIQVIRTLPVNRDELWVADGVLPPVAPDIGLRTSEFGDRAHAAPVNDNYRPSGFMRRMGFDLILGFTTTYRRSDVEAQVNDVIARKDRAENDWLLLTAGGPNAQGLTFPGEEFAASLLVERPVTIRPPTHLRRVVLHRWGTGDAWELFPAPQQLVPRARPDLPAGLSYEMPRLPVDLAPGRNVTCPCGSGRAFKRCHGAPVDFSQMDSGLLVPR